MMQLLIWLSRNVSLGDEEIEPFDLPNGDDGDLKSGVRAERGNSNTILNLDHN